MQSEDLSLEKVDPMVIVKEDPSSSTLDSEDRLNMFTPVYIPPNNIIATPPSSYNEYDREHSADSPSIYSYNETEQTKIRLAEKYTKIDAAKDWLSNFPDWLRPKEKTIPEVGDWIDSIEAILKHAELPRVVLGFMGPSGCGKSSAINALLEEESLLPCNCSEACTGVAVEVAWNPIDDFEKAYRAKIQFITAAEWKAELDLLVAELITLEPGTSLNKSGNDAKVAMAKLKTVYPNLAIGDLTEGSASELMNDTVVSKWFGKEVEIEMPADEGESFAEKISQYIDSRPRPAGSGGKLDNATPYWPPVKVVQIFARSQVLSTGLVLVDLPGSGDSNAARQVVAQEYMNQVSAICIVADIKRAVTEEIARNLFGRGQTLKRRLLRDGLLDDEHTFFVLTCTDIINNQQVITARGLDKLPEVSEILKEQESKSGRLQSVIAELNNLQPKKCRVVSNIPQKRPIAAGGRPDLQIAKRKKSDNKAVAQVIMTAPSIRDYGSATVQKSTFSENIRKSISELKAEKKNINDELDFLKGKLSAICIRQRNSYVTFRMKEDFSGGLEDLEKELRDNGDEEADHIPRPEDSIRDGVDTFCVCSKAYQRFRGRFPLEEMPLGFDDEEDTSFPQLHSHCMEYTLNARERLADTFLDDLTRLRRRMRDWADNTTPDKEITSRQKRLLEESFASHLSCLEKMISDVIHSVAAKLRTDLHSLSWKTLRFAVPAAARTSLGTFGIWEEKVQSAGAWKAIRRKEGIHVSRAGGVITEHNWNEDLAEEFSKLLHKNLGKIPARVLPELQQECNAKFQKGFEKFIVELKSISLEITKHISSSLQNFVHNYERSQVDSSRAVDSKYAVAIASSRIIDQKVSTAVRFAMKPGYIRAASVSGQGALMKSKTVIEQHIEENTNSMYAKAASKISEGLEEIVAILKNNLTLDFKKTVKKISADFEKMLAVAGETARPESGAAKVELQKDVLDKLGRFDLLLGDYIERMAPLDTSAPEDDEEEEDIDEESGNDSDEDDDAQEAEDEDDSSQGDLEAIFDDNPIDSTPKVNKISVKEEMDEY